MKTKYWVILSAIILLGIGLRIYNLGTREIWYDEAFSFFLAKQSLPDIVLGTAADTEPPLYYFLLHFWQLLGSDLFELRMLSVIISIGIIGLAFDLSRRIAGGVAGLWTALFISISPFQIYHSQEVRMYGLLALTQLAYYWFFILLIQSNSTQKSYGKWVGLIISGVAAVYSQNLAIFGLVLPGLYLLITRKWKCLRNLLMAQTGIIVLSIPWLVNIPGQIQKIQTAFYTPVPGVVEIFQAIIQAHAFMPLKGALLIIVSVISLQCFVLIAIEIYKARKLPGLGVLVILAVGLPALLFLTSYLMRPIFVPRGFIIAMVIYLVLAGWVVSLTWKNGIGVILAFGLILSAAISLPEYFNFSEFPRSKFRIATNFLLENTKQNDLILHDNKLSFFPSHYYAPSLEQAFLADEAGSHNDTYALNSQKAIQLFPEPDLASAISGRDKIWFVVFNRAVTEYIEMGEDGHPIVAQLDTLYSLEHRYQFGDLEIYEYLR